MLEGDYRDHPGHSYAPVERKSVYWFTRCNRQADVAGRPIACARQRADDPTGASGRGVFLRKQKPHRDALESQQGPDGCCSKL
jgi:hypothetical protein